MAAPWPLHVNLAHQYCRAAATWVMSAVSECLPPMGCSQQTVVLQDLRTPAPAAAKEPTSAGGEKRSSEARVKSGSASAKRQRGCGQAVTPSKGEHGTLCRPLPAPFFAVQSCCNLCMSTALLSINTCTCCHGRESPKKSLPIA